MRSPRTISREVDGQRVICVTRIQGPEQSSMAMVESKAFEFLLEGCPFAIRAHHIGHDALDVVQACSNRCYDGVVMQNRLEHRTVRGFGCK